MATEMVTAFLRHGPDVLLFERSDAVGSYPDRWGGAAGHADDVAAAAADRRTWADWE